jgi:hypothetical protein
MPKPVDVPQDMEPWAEALLALLTHRAAYDQESARSRAVALKFVSSLRVETFEEYLLQLHPREPVVAPAGPKTSDLTPAQRALLLKRLRDRK